MVMELLSGVKESEVSEPSFRGILKIVPAYHKGGSGRRSHRASSTWAGFGFIDGLGLKSEERIRTPGVAMRDVTWEYSVGMISRLACGNIHTSRVLLGCK